jgi:broad specificity phosphatase PhoE
MLTILYAPHMTSSDNEARRASGHADVPLAASGRQQALALGQHFAAEPLAAVFASDLQRAAETARLAFAGRVLPQVTDARLREYDYGDLTRCPVARVEEEFPLRLNEPFPHGESLLMVVERVGAFLQEVVVTYDSTMIAVIGHRATKYGLDYWCGEQSLAAIVQAPWEWRTVPIWRYHLDAQQFARRMGTLPEATSAHPHVAPSAAPGPDAAADAVWTEQSAPDS